MDKKWFFVVLLPYTAPLLELNYFFLSFCRISFWIGWKQTNGQQLIRLICYICWSIPWVANFSTERAKLYKNDGTCWTKLIIHVRKWVKLYEKYEGLRLPRLFSNNPKKIFSGWCWGSLRSQILSSSRLVIKKYVHASIILLSDTVGLWGDCKSIFCHRKQHMNIMVLT